MLNPLQIHARPASTSSDEPAADRRLASAADLLTPSGFCFETGVILVVTLGIVLAVQLLLRAFRIA